MQLSPLGQYAPVVAAVVAVGVIAAYLLALLIPGVDASARDALQVPAAIALGAVFGSSVAVNGWKTPVAAQGAKLDKAVHAITTVAASSPNPSVAGTVSSILGSDTVSPGTMAAGNG